MSISLCLRFGSDFFSDHCKNCTYRRGMICTNNLCCQDHRSSVNQNSITSEQARQLRQRERQELLGKTKEELVDMILGKEYNIY